jgi:uncharacterized protein (TIGR02597 family)
LTFLNPPLHVGSLSSVSGTSVTDSSGTWQVDDFADFDADGNSLYYLEVTSGQYEGLTVDIVSNTADTITLSDDASFLSADLVNGLNYTIRKHYTIGDVFSADNTTYGLHSSGSAAEADIIYLINNSGEFERFFYQTAPPFAGGAGWRKVGDVSTDYSTRPINTGSLLLSRNGAVARSSIDLTFYGNVKIGKQVTPLYVGNNLVANAYPLDVSLGSSGLFESNFVSASTVSDADVVYVLNSDGAFERYFYQDAPPFAGGAGWRKVGDVSTDQSNLVIPAGTAFIVLKSGSIGIDWIQAQPF